MISLARTILALAALATPFAASARPAATTTRLVSCEAGDCLLVRGHRASPRDAVRINGRAVAADGGSAWRVRVPLATVREWSAPFARSVQVAVGDAADATGEAVSLPVGLLARRLELASLVVRAR